MLEAMPQPTNQPTINTPQPPASGGDAATESKPKAKRGKGTYPESEQFGRFWDSWPNHHRKHARNQCAGIWCVHNLDNIAERVIAAVEWFKGTTDWTKEAGQYIPAPLVWLRQRRWEAAESVAESKPQQKRLAFVEEY